MTYYFKASYDKANRTSVEGKRGIGLDQTMKDFLKLKLAFPPSLHVIVPIPVLVQVEIYLYHQCTLYRN